MNSMLAARAAATPLISVIIPTRNRANLLRHALRSVFAQAGRDELFALEVIVVDDASSDETPEVVTEFPEVRYLQFDTNRGPSAARNAGIATSQGKYLAFLDDDDVWLPTRLKVQVPILETHPDVGIVYGHGLVKTPDGRIVIWPESGPSGWVFEDLLVRTDDFINIDTLLVRKDLLALAGTFDEAVETMEHYDFALRLAYYSRWSFVEGPIVRGRELKQGKHYRDISNGVNERSLPGIVEKALALLPDSSSSELVRRQARTAVCSTIAEQRWRSNGGAEAVKSYLLSQLRARPWLIAKSAIWQQVRKVVRSLAVSAPDPLTTVAALWNDLRSVVGPNHLVPELEWGAILAEAAEAVREDGGAPFKAATLAWSGLKRNPAHVNRRLLRILANAALLCATRPARLLLNAWDIIPPEKRWATMLERLARSPNVYFVEIGAMDGVAFDPLHDAVIRHGWHGLLVEPLPDLYADLQETYRGVAGVRLENIAIAETPGTRTLFRVNPEAVETGLVPIWAKGIASFYQDRNALGGQRISREEFERIRPHLITEQVRCDTLANLLERQGVSKIDVLQIDVEGFDYHVLKQVDFERYRPAIIRMEWYNLPQDEQRLSRALLQRWGYRTAEVGADLLAWHNH